MTRHRQVKVAAPAWAEAEKINVDIGMASLLQELWSKSFVTIFSCQNWRADPAFLSRLDRENVWDHLKEWRAQIVFRDKLDENGSCVESALEQGRRFAAEYGGDANWAESDFVPERPDVTGYNWLSLQRDKWQFGKHLDLCFVYFPRELLDVKT